MANQYPRLILFCYPESVYSRRLESYLLLRHIPFERCIQPRQMPRPDLTNGLGVQYRRIPIVAIGRDIYVDTRLIISKLETLFPTNKLGSGSLFEQGLESIFESFTIDAGPFWRTAGILPLNAPLLNDAVWLKDRYDLTGGRFTRENLEKGRPEALANLRIFFSFAEKLLANGRKWVLGGDSVGLADIHLGWTYGWALRMSMNAAGEEHAGGNVLTKETFPRVVEWVERFAAEVQRAEDVVKPGTVSSADAIGHILGSGLFEQEGEIDPVDPLGLRKGQTALVGPGDHGGTHQDRGEVSSVTATEIAIRSVVPDGKGSLMIHYPRVNITIQAQ